jgi:hypothetical protein
MAIPSGETIARFFTMGYAACWWSSDLAPGWGAFFSDVSSGLESMGLNLVNPFSTGFSVRCVKDN